MRTFAGLLLAAVFIVVLGLELRRRLAGELDPPENEQANEDLKSSPERSAETLASYRAIHASLFVQNAFRTLGTHASASWTELQSAASSIRRKEALGLEVASDWDLPSLGPVARQEPDVQAAIGRLEDPTQRLRERLLWLLEEDPPNMASRLSAHDNADRELLPSRWAEMHDLGIRELLMLGLEDPAIEQTDAWREAIQLWLRWAIADPAWTVLLEPETAGGFPRAATQDHLSRLRAHPLSPITEVFATLAREATSVDDLATCQRVLTLLRDSELSLSETSRLESEVLGPLEDRLKATCAHLSRACNERIERTSDANREANRKACIELEADFDYQVAPLLQRIRKAAGPHSQLASRGAEYAADLLHTIGTGITWADEYSESARILERAIELAHGTPAESRIAEALEQARANAAAQKRQREEQVDVAPTLWTINGCGLRLYGRSDPDPRTDTFVATHYLTILFIPILPLARYRVRQYSSRRYQFYGRLPLRAGDYWHIGIVAALFLGLCVGAAESNGSEGSVTSALATRNTSQVHASPASAPETSGGSGVATPTKNPAGGVFRDAKDRLHTQIDAGRRRIHDLETRLQQQESRIDSLRSRIDSYAARIRTMEVDAKADDVVDQDEYERLLTVHNALVPTYNEAVRQYKSLYSEYDSLIEKDHRMVSQYNSGQ